MESIIVDGLVKDLSDSVAQIKSITDCISDREFTAANKLLKRHQKCVEDTTKKMRQAVCNMSNTMKNQRLTIAGMKQDNIKKEMASSFDIQPRTNFEDVDMMGDDELTAFAKAAEEDAMKEDQQKYPQREDEEQDKDDEQHGEEQKRNDEDQLNGDEQTKDQTKSSEDHQQDEKQIKTSRKKKCDWKKKGRGKGVVG